MTLTTSAFPRLLGSVVLVAVAASGIIAGIAVDRTLLQPTAIANATVPVPGAVSAGAPQSMEARRRMMVERMARALDLTPQQRVQLDAVIERRLAAVQAARALMRPRLQGALDSARIELDRILTPVQRERFRALRQQQMAAP